MVQFRDETLCDFSLDTIYVLHDIIRFANMRPLEGGRAQCPPEDVQIVEHFFLVFWHFVDDDRWPEALSLSFVRAADRVIFSLSDEIWVHSSLKITI